MPGLIRNRINKAALRSLRKRGSHVPRFLLTRRAAIRQELLRNPAIARAALQHAVENAYTEEASWLRIQSYIDEIVPFFNILAYYRFGYTVSKWLLNMFYRVSAEHLAPGAVNRVPRNAIVIYLMNHRSNADYVLVGYVLTGKVAISYAVGEWARAFPLEYIFKSFGSYFIRRNYREPLYHTVLEQYVQLITKNGITQGIFPEGGLSRDGKLRPARIGLLDYILGVARDESFRSRMYIVPVAINYDRVLEDRSLLRELASRERGARTPVMTQLREVVRYVWWNAARVVMRRWKRYGRATVNIGEPIPLEPWFDRQDSETGGFFTIERTERLARVQALADEVMRKIGAIVPVTPVTLTCAAIQSLDSHFIPRERLLQRMSEMRDVLRSLNASVIRAEGEIADTLALAMKMLRMRRMAFESGSGIAVSEKNRALISYYANSIAHLLGPFEAGVRERDSLPADTLGIA